MNLKAFLFDDDRGVSPVIGVILMVAITVILAAVIATFVMNMGPDENTVPNTQWKFTDDGASNPTVTLTHDGGEAATVGEFKLAVQGTSDEANLEDPSSLGASDEMTAGDSVDFDGATTGFSSLSNLDGETIQLIWENPSNDETQVVKEYDV